MVSNLLLCGFDYHSNIMLLLVSTGHVSKSVLEENIVYKL